MRRIYRAGTLSGIMKSIFFFSCFLYAELTEGVIIKVDGFEGRNVSFQCSHTLAWKNHKYFCKDPCTRVEDKLVTVESGRRAESGRITLVDSANGSFSVTFSHLQLSDSQKYRCGVDRPGLDTYIDVQLTVMKSVENETDISSTLPYPNPTLEKSTTGNIICATVGGVILISVLMMAVCFRKSRRTSNDKLQVYTNRAHTRNSNESEVSFGYNDTDKRTNNCSKLSASSSVSTYQQRSALQTFKPI
ncbi:uncharacterized protein LOC112847187 isoform X2 [Oreochromis niloticus]|uniref:uncharacterized protein LOC112847187 isoform X2 n=1 Tax=Oreochromis niloticus TaxID=8128 RepID=UPI000DF2AB65|nr:uncharacterized protein LOC112847187 isoform X2 [Oreochromis niloticus]